jgi:Dolichyl-phosphate-mannose-protein mannosyltransferase
MNKWSLISMKRYLSKNLVLITAGLFLLGYVILRAYNLSFTHDESLSYTIITGNAQWVNTANNHLLNTLLMRLCAFLFGYSEIALRIPNVLSFVLYFYAFYLLVKPSAGIFLSALAIALLLLNPFFIDFFSISRGYGISMGCMLLSLYYLLQLPDQLKAQKPEIKKFSFSLLLAALAIYANLTLLNFYISCLLFSGIYFLLIKRNSKRFEFKANLKFYFLLLLSFIPLFLALNRLLLLQSLNELYAGETSFFLSLKTLVLLSFYLTDYPAWLCTSFIAFFFISISLGIVLLLIKRDFSGRFALITFLLLSVLLALVLEFYLFDTKYPSERTGLYIIPLYGLFVFYFAEHIILQYAVSKKIYQPFLAMVCLAFLYHFANSLNLQYTRTWYVDLNIKKAMQHINEKTQKSTTKKSISNVWLFEPTINYYIATKKMNLNFTTREGINYNSDFIYCFKYDSVPTQYSLLLEYSDNNTSLWIKNPK